MLIPVNLAGVAESLRQELTGKRIPFRRTPGVGGGTTASAAVLAAEYLLLLYATSGVVVDSLHRRWLHAAYSLITAACFAYAIFRLIHAGEAGEAPDKPAADVMASARARLEMEPAAEREIEPAPV